MTATDGTVGRSPEGPELSTPTNVYEPVWVNKRMLAVVDIEPESIRDRITRLL